VTLSKDARARAVQLPAWNEALGLPRAWDQQWSLRAQQILALESDLLEYDDLFEGSKVVEETTARIGEEAWDEVSRVLERGGSVEALGYMKERLVASLADRMRHIESGERVVVGLNAYTESEPSPLGGDMGEGSGMVERIEQETEAEQVERVAAWRKQRDARAAGRAIDAVRRAAQSGENLMPLSIEAARAGVTTGEWADALRDVFGEYRPPTGIGGVAAAVGEPDSLADARRRVHEAIARRGVQRLRMLVGKPGLDGHSNAAEQVAVRARDAGFEVIYQGLRLTPAEIARAAADEDVHLIGLSIMSGAHMLLVPEVLDRLRQEGVDPERVPVVVGGVISNDESKELMSLGVARVYTPHDHDLTRMVGEMADLIG